jgi:hypothetical protein
LTDSKVKCIAFVFSPLSEAEARFVFRVALHVRGHGNGGAGGAVDYRQYITKLQTTDILH